MELLKSLHAGGVRNGKAACRAGTLALTVSGDRYRYASRGVGRTALSALAYAPLESRRLGITWAHRGMDGMSWEFRDVPLLERYFAGQASRQQLAHTVTLRYAYPGGRSRAAQANDMDQTLNALARQAQGRFQFSRHLSSVSASKIGRASCRER